MMRFRVLLLYHYCRAKKRHFGNLLRSIYTMYQTNYSALPETTSAAQKGNKPCVTQKAEWAEMQQLVARIARQYYLPPQSPLEEEDLLQEGYLGWLEAKRRFDAQRLSCEQSQPANREEAFKAYAAHWVHKYISDALHRYRSALSYPPSHPLDDTLPIRSLDTVVHQGEEEADSITLADVLSDTAPTPEQKMLHTEDRQRLQTALQRLSSRERMLITRLYGLDGEASDLPQSSMTAYELAAEQGISYWSIRKMHARALRKMQFSCFPSAIRSRQVADK